MSSNYVLLMNVKNEEQYVNVILEDICSQKILPELLVIVDDASSDRTCEIVQSYLEKFIWVKLYKSDLNDKENFAIHLSKLRAYTMDLLIRQCVKNNIDYEFIGIVDADMHFDCNFYQKVISELNADDRLGIVSASLYEPTIGGKYYLKFSRDDAPGCGTMVFRKKCLEDIGGVPENMYPEDAIMVARAKLKNWRTKRFKNITATQRRKTHWGNTPWQGNMFYGEKVFFLRYPLIYVFLKALHISFSERFDLGIAFLWGHFRKTIKADKRLEDPELIKYFRRTWFKENIKSIFKHFQPIKK